MTYQYDELNRLTNMSLAHLATPIASYAYALNQAGHRTQVRELGGRTVSYSYDSLYRLTQETISGALVAGQINYTLDAVGNRLNRTSTLTNILSKLYGHDSNDRLDSDTYDLNGNTLAALIKAQGASLEAPVSCTYDFENRLLSVTSAYSVVSLLYDGDGSRVGKTVNGVTTRYLVDDRNLTGYSQVLEDLTCDLWSLTSAVTRVYAFGLDLLSQDQITGTNWVLSFYSYDGHGSVRQLTDVSGQVTDTFDYDGFGGIVSRTGSTPNNFLYAGECFDPDIGLYFLRARYLDVDRGRLWTMDAFEGTRSDPASLHKYAYAHANPLAFIDPSGCLSIVEGVLVSAIIADLSEMTHPWHPRVVIELVARQMAFMPWYHDAPPGLHSYILISYLTHQWVVAAYASGRWGSGTSNDPLWAHPVIEYADSDEYGLPVLSRQVLLKAQISGWIYRAMFQSFADRVNHLRVTYLIGLYDCNTYAYSAARHVLKVNPRIEWGASGGRHDILDWERRR